MQINFSYFYSSVNVARDQIQFVVSVAKYRNMKNEISPSLSIIFSWGEKRISYYTSLLHGAKDGHLLVVNSYQCPVFLTICCHFLHATTCTAHSHKSRISNVKKETKQIICEMNSCTRTFSTIESLSICAGILLLLPLPLLTCNSR